MIFRRAEEKDMDRINELLYQVCLVHHIGRPDLFKYGTKKYTDDELRELIHNENCPILVAADEEDVVLGYAFCKYIYHPHDNVLTDIRTLYIDDLCVDEKIRSKGVGSFIYENVVKFAKENGCYNITLNVWECNPTAKRFYEKCGLKPQKYGMETIL